MSNQAHFQEMAFSLLRYLKSKKEAMLARHAVELEGIEKEIEAVSITVRLMQESDDADKSPEPEVKQSAAIPGDLRGKSTREACIEIAKQNDGIVRVADAKRALVSARILKESKNTWAIIYTTLHRSKEFEKGKGAGEFRLLTYPAKTETQASFLQ